VAWVVVPEDVSARLNNWNQVKSRKLTTAVFTGFGAGSALALLIVGLVQTGSRNRGQRDP
jgi:hypothetical protein